MWSRCTHRRSKKASEPIAGLTESTSPLTPVSKDIEGNCYFGLMRATQDWKKHENQADMTPPKDLSNLPVTNQRRGELQVIW